MKPPIPIQESVSPLQPKDFHARFFSTKTPVIIKGGVNHWKASQLWTPEYFQALFPNKLIGVYRFERKEGLWGRSLLKDIPMGQAITWMRENQNPDVKYYIIRDAISKNYPELKSDFENPHWTDVEKYLCSSLWVGEAGNTTPLHFDTAENFLVQIYGRKKLSLFSPKDNHLLYVHNLYTKGRMNFSQIRDLDADNHKQFPRLEQASVYQGIIGPGDAIYIPPGWWHEVKTLDFGISINFFFEPSKKKGPLWHLLGYLACRIDEKKLILETIDHLSAPNYANVLQAAECVNERGVPWIAVLISGLVLESWARTTYDCFDLHFSELMHKIDGEHKPILTQALPLIERAMLEDKSHISEQEAGQLISQVKKLF